MPSPVWCAFLFQDGFCVPVTGHSGQLDALCLCSRVPRVYHLIIKYLDTTHLSFFLFFFFVLIFFLLIVQSSSTCSHGKFQRGWSATKPLQAYQQRSREDWFISTFASSVPVQEEGLSIWFSPVGRNSLFLTWAKFLHRHLRIWLQVFLLFQAFFLCRS